MTSPGYLLKKFLAHLREGTLQQRFASALRERRWARRDRWWEGEGKLREFMDHEVEPGVSLRLYFDSAIAQDIYCHDHEVAERAFVRFFLRPGDVFVDIGANLGLYSVLASGLVGPGGAVFSFEPDPKTHERLLFNLKTNGCTNVQPFQCALSNADETRTMQISGAGFDAYNSFATPVRGEGTFQSREVACVSFDSFASQHPAMQKAAMVKVDVEGWEAMVLQGAKKQLSGDAAPVLLIEFNDQAAKSSGQPCSELYRWLQSLGYSMFTFEARGKRLVPLPHREHYVYDNVLAMKNTAFVTGRIGGTVA